MYIITGDTLSIQFIHTAFQLFFKKDFIKSIYLINQFDVFVSFHNIIFTNSFIYLPRFERIYKWSVTPILPPCSLTRSVADHYSIKRKFHEI